MKRQLLWVAAWSALLVNVGCAGNVNEVDESGDTGSLLLLLELANGETLDQVEYVLTRGGMEPMSGTIDTSAPGATASLEVFGLVPGDGYRITMTAAAADGVTRCTGATDFSVRVGEATEIMVVLKCVGPPRFGAVRANGKLNICAELTKMVVSPLRTSVGNSVDLSAAGEDADQDPFTIRWNATGGSLASDTGSDNELTCEVEGEGSVTAEVSDDQFEHCVSGWTIAVTCVASDGSGGVGGEGASGGTAGQGGTGGLGGSAGEGGFGGAGGGGGDAGFGGELGTPALDALPTAPRFAVVSSNFVETSIAVLDDDFAILDDDWLSSDSTFDGLLAPLSGDVVLPTRQAGDGTVAVVDRLGTDVVSRFFVPSGNLNGQVRTEGTTPSVFSSNPHDFIFVDETSAWATRYEQNPNPSAPPVDQGTDLLEVNPMSMTLTGRRIDLSSLNTMQNAQEILARPNRGALVGSTLVVGLDRLSADFVSAAGPGMVAVVDLNDESVEGLPLETGLANCGNVAPVPGAPTKLVVACVGFPFGSRQSAGVALLEVAPGRITIEATWRVSDDPSSAIAVQSVVSVGGSKVAAVATGDFGLGTGDGVYLLELETGEQDLIYESAGPFEVGGLAHDPSSARLYVPDAGANAVVELVLEDDGATETRATSISTRVGFSPRAVYLLEEGDGTCSVPSPAVFDTIHAGATLKFDQGPTEVGTSTRLDAVEPDSWILADEYTFANGGSPYSVKLFARFVDEPCRFEHVYEVTEAYAPAAGEPGSTAVDEDSTAFVAWADGFVEPIDYGSEVDEEFRTPENALGPATGDGSDIVALGNGGSITLTFAPPITNGEGFDFAVFENSFVDFNFLELAFVEVSSNGVDFVRFPSAYLGSSPLGPFELIDSPSIIEGLASKYWVGQGTPFDLDVLRFDPFVQTGALNLRAITHVRIVDIIGDGTATDSFGNPIYDPTPTAGSGGVDLEAIGVLHQAP